MSKLITEEVSNQLSEQFQQLKEPVQLIFFTQPHECGACSEQRELLESIVRLSDKLALQVHQLDSKEAQSYGIDKAPATVVRGETDYGIRFYGLTGGYEFASLLEAISMVSQGEGSVEPAMLALATMFTEPLHLEIMVTLSCPYCPRMVHLAQQLAMVNPLISADMVDAAEFPQLISRYDIHGTPLTVINGRRGFEGALPAEQAILEILKIAEPERYEQIEQKLREARGLRKVEELSSDELYDVIVIGAGPAGVTAALYAQRKGYHTALIAHQAGGQVNDTATIENYPGLIRVGGSDLAQAMREQIESYPIAERFHSRVSHIDRDGGNFIVHTDEEGKSYRGRTVIFCAGKRYRRLNAAGEEKFIGRGIAWCATCDAPLYQDKSVAVVGGGNSAFTAVRDLLHYAKQIHLIHLHDSFNADPLLVEEARQAGERVKFHLGAQVREYLGKESLTGVRLSTGDGSPLFDLAVDGVFLEIGLEPNSGAVEKLVQLNEQNEIPVTRDQETTVPGLFAAGDVTDEPEKQIVIAAGAGAKAALSAARYHAKLKAKNPAE